jgi:hypothetical protein
MGAAKGVQQRTAKCYAAACQTLLWVSLFHVELLNLVPGYATLCNAG